MRVFFFAHFQAGMLIIEDAANEVPDLVRDMVEVPLMVNQIDLATIVDIQQEFNNKILKVTGDTSQTLLLVNGQTAPSLDIVAGKWHRFRIAYAAVETVALVTWESSSNAKCSLQLLAKDGVYLPHFPRKVRSSILDSNTKRACWRLLLALRFTPHACSVIRWTT